MYYVCEISCLNSLRALNLLSLSAPFLIPFKRLHQRLVIGAFPTQWVWVAK